MSEKTFEEQFPSLKNHLKFSFGMVDDFVFKEEIEKHCLDKQRVREVLTSLKFSEDKIKNDFPENTQFAKGANAAIKAALENLGLDEVEK